MPLPQCVRSEAALPGWREIGWFVVYERNSSAAGYMPSVRMMEHWEPPLIRAMAEGFEHDRLHMDPMVSNREADAFKVGVVDNALANEWPVLTCGQPDTWGFLIVRPEKPIAHIDLVGVHPNYRRKGIGTYLVTHFVNWAHDNAFDFCRAGTMEANSAACCLYETSGFMVVEKTRIWHR